MRFNRIWQSHRASMKHSSQVSSQKTNRPQLFVEDLEGRAMPSATLPNPTVETRAALHLKPIDPVQAVSHGVTVLAWARVDGSIGARGWSVADDVVVDGRVITAPTHSREVGNEYLILFGGSNQSTPASLPASPNLVRFNSSTPGTSHDDVFIDTWIITVPAHSMARSHELGHALGFRHEHVQPLAEPIQADWYFMVARGTRNMSSGTDTNNHGTHVAGTIGAIGNNGGATSSTPRSTTPIFRAAEQDDPMSASDAPYQGKRSSGGYVPT